MTTNEGTIESVYGDKAFFGHPKGLSTLFMTEMWERLSYYGMRAILLLYMTAELEKGGLGWDTRSSAAIYGLYTSSVWFLPLIGGWIADRFIGGKTSCHLDRWNNHNRRTFSSCLSADPVLLRGPDLCIRRNRVSKIQH